MSNRDRRQIKALVEKHHDRDTQTPERTYADQRAPSPRALTNLEFVALRLHEAAIRRDGTEALSMDVAVASVDAARILLREARRGK